MGRDDRERNCEGGRKRKERRMRKRGWNWKRYCGTVRAREDGIGKEITRG